MNFVRGLLLGTATSYAKVLCRAICGLVTFRMLREGLGDAHFGFWTVLWSTFGIMILVDFGLGYSVQRTVARAIGDRSPEARRAMRGAIATVFWIGVALTAAVGACAWAAGDRVLDFLFAQSHVEDPAERAHLAGVAVLFAGAMLMSYPFGLFREVLRGQHRLYIADAIDICGMLAQTALVAYGRRTGWGLDGYMTAAACTTIAPVLLIALVTMIDADLRPDPRNFSRRDLRELSSFSIYAYFNALSGMVIARSDALLIGHCISLPAVAWYAAGQKVAETYGTLAQQMQAMLGATSAHLDARSADDEARRAALRRLLLITQRWAVMIGASLAVPLAMDLPGALRLLNGHASLGASSGAIAVLLLISTAITIVGTSCAKPVLLLTGHHRAVLAFSLGEACTKITIGVWLLVSTHDITGAAIGSVAASALFGLVVVPWYAHRAFGIGWDDVAGASARGVVGASTAILAGAAWRACSSMPGTVGFLAGTAVVAAAMPFGWWWFGMIPAERDRVAGWIARLAPAFARRRA